MEIRIFNLLLFIIPLLFDLIRNSSDQDHQVSIVQVELH